MMKSARMSLSYVLVRPTSFKKDVSLLCWFVVVLFVVHVSKCFQKTGDYIVSTFPEFRDMYCFTDLRHKCYHTSLLPYFSQVAYHINIASYWLIRQIRDVGNNSRVYCSILGAEMGGICELSFAVILVLLLTEGTSSNEGKASHWLLVFV